MNGLIAWFRTSASETDFEEIYRVELPRIYNYFRYRVGDGPLAEDLTSETFEKAWRNRWRYRRDLAAFSTWLFTIARRVLQDHYRKKHDDLPLEQVTEPGIRDDLEDLIEQQADFAQLPSFFPGLQIERGSWWLSNMAPDSPTAPSPDSAGSVNRMSAQFSTGQCKSCARNGRHTYE